MTESKDFGQGGCALAVDSLQPGSVDVFFAPVAAHTSRGNYPPPPGSSLSSAGYQASELHWLRYTSGPLASVASVSLVPSADDARGGYGVCGLAVVQLLADPPNDKQLVVTTFAGDLFVYDLILPSTLQLRYRTWVAGSLGAHNSIVVADLGAPDGPELYIAGSMGLRRWVRNP